MISSELIGEPVLSTEGVLTKGTVVAQHTMRARDAVVIEGELAGRRRKVPAGTALAETEFAGDSIALANGQGVRTAWCDVRRLSVFANAVTDCLVDTDQDGRFDENRWGFVDGYFGFVVPWVGKASPLPAPIPYRRALPQERPRALVGYRYCTGDGMESPPRFELNTRQPEDKEWSGSGEYCPYGVWPDPADRTRVTVEDVELKVTPGPQPGFVVTRTLNARPLGLVGPGGSLAKASEAATPKERVATALKALARSPLRAAGVAQLQTGPVPRGEVLLSLPVKHAITGRLQNRIVQRGLFGRDVGQALEIGDPVYGLLGGAGVVWCSPTQAGRARDAAVCVSGQWSEQRPVYFPSFSFPSQYASLADAASVVEAPIDFGVPMSVEYRFARVAKTSIQLNMAVTSPGGVAKGWFYEASRGADGGAVMAIAGGRLKLRPAADNRSITVEVLEPLTGEGVIPFF